MKNDLLGIQKRVLQAVVRTRAPVYLVGGTALAMYFGHRASEDLDFFTHRWTPHLHASLAARIAVVTGSQGTLRPQRLHPKRLKIAVYDFPIGRTMVLKVDIVEDPEVLLRPVGANGLASLDDLYLRKLRAVIGWRWKQSVIGRPLTGGREATKDLFDLWYLSTHYQPLSEWFVSHFNQDDYGRLADWFRRMSQHSTSVALLEMKPGCDTGAVRRHLEHQIFDQLNQYYVRA